jgi:L-threonylcarbamoyladenylate synthase
MPPLRKAHPAHTPERPFHLFLSGLPDIAGIGELQNTGLRTGFLPACAPPQRSLLYDILALSATLSATLIEFDRDNPAADVVQCAAEAIRQGKVVAIPTDALYVLAADPFNLHAVGRVFQAKGREIHRSLPVLVDSLFMAEDLATNLSSRFYLLARHFWPGPLTMIVPASAKVPLKVTGNTGRLAVRHARADIANQIIEALGMPIIATSANISGLPTCRSGIDVLGCMDNRLDLILDGGLVGGPGATTVDVTEPYWRVIREGAISESEIAECLKG